MRAVHFMKIDWMMTKTQTRVLWLFAVIALLLSFMQGSLYWAPLYMMFGGLMMATTPFCIRQQSNNGFLLLLPATEQERVAGRFLYGIVILMISLVCGGIDMFLVVVVKHIQVPYTVPFYIGIVVVGLILIALQDTILYIVGELKSQQMMGVIRMIPGFLFFFGGIFVAEFLEEYYAMEGQALKSDWFIWICNHQNLCCFLALAIGILIFGLGFFISVQVVKRRDFA